MNKRGFTLVELVIVIMVLGILAAVAMPKFVDIVADAKVSSTKAGLGAIRAVVALKYAKNMQTNAATNTVYYPRTIASTDFFDGKMPKNALNGRTSISVGATPGANNATSASVGWWYCSTNGAAGAYLAATTTGVNSSDW